MKICFICGSHRSPSQSFKVTAYLAERLMEISDCEPVIIELARTHLPYWDPGFRLKTEEWKEVWDPISKELNESEGLIITTPEWEGMVPPKLKNFFLLCSKEEVGHKPGLIVGVSSGTGGSNPVNELRISSFKNNRLCYMPEHLIIRQVQTVLNNYEGYENSHDEYYKNRIDYVLELFVEYVKAFRLIRDSGKTFREEFKFGM